MGFWPEGFVLVRWIQALQGLISAESWAFLDASTELVLIKKGLLKKWAEKVQFQLGPRVESPRFEWTWTQAIYELGKCYRQWRRQGKKSGGQNDVTI